MLVSSIPAPLPISCLWLFFCPAFPGGAYPPSVYLLAGNLSNVDFSWRYFAGCCASDTVWHLLNGEGGYKSIGHNKKHILHTIPNFKRNNMP